MGSSGPKTVSRRSVFRRLRCGLLLTLCLFTAILLSLNRPASASRVSSASVVVSPTLLGAVLATEESSNLTLSRDDGLSVAVPGRNDLWIYGDSAEYSRSSGSGPWTLQDFIEGSTAAEGGYQVGSAPTDLNEVNIGRPIQPGDHPSQFVPGPSDVYNPNGSGGLCTPGAASGTPTSPDSTTVAYAARWPNGVTYLRSSKEVLVTYMDVCVLNDGAFPTEGWGFMELDPSTNDISVGPTDVFLPARDGASLAAEYIFGSPTVSRHRITLFSSQCTDSAFGVCAAGGVYETTFSATTKNLENVASYVPTPISTSSATAWEPFGVSVASYSGRLMLVEMTSVAGAFDVYSATSATTAWSLQVTGTLPGCLGLSHGFCYAFVGHPEISNAAQMLVSYYDPAYGPDTSVGHLVAASVPLS